VSSTNDPVFMSTPGVMVLLVEPALMVATPLVLNLSRPFVLSATGAQPQRPVPLPVP
jgi:hypothetical protein